tara:strand:- start:83 stop:1282 length:1200 start_codon:yes stop_codon:yes gene_type:complete
MKFTFNILVVIFSFAAIFGQNSQRDYSEELRYQNEAINALKDEIQNLREKIKKTESRERSTIRRISTLDEEVALITRLIQSLRSEEGKTRNRIEILKKDLQLNEQELELLRLRYEQRVINTFMKGRLTDLEKVLSSTSWRQAMYRTHYLKIISDIEQEMTVKIERLLIQISKQKLELEASLRDNINLKRDKEKQMQSLRNMKINRQKELTRIRTDKKALGSYIAEKKAGIKQLENIIKKILEDKSRFEREDRIRRQREAMKTKSFQNLQGQLPWPADGRITAKFGRQWNSQLKTTTENPGIDIKGQPGSPIRVVLSGVITTITYIRGYGTTIIVDHGSAFYTVYSHVTNIQTSVDSEIRAGDVIAYMGESGSINGSKLHFEIWGKGQKLDPEKWLTKKQ